MSNPDSDPLNVDPSFIEENKKLVTTRQKSGGPYSKGQRRKRRQEVFRLHFQEGVPAIKIANLMQINRNTINQDINWLCDKMVEDIKGEDFNGYFGKQMVRLETQRARLFAYLSEAKDLDHKLTIEKQLSDLDFRLASMLEKFKFNQLAFWDATLKKFNEEAGRLGLDKRFTTLFELYKISWRGRKAIDSIHKTINEDRRLDQGE